MNYLVLCILSTISDIGLLRHWLSTIFIVFYWSTLDVGEGSKLKVQTFNYSILQQTFKKVRCWRLETFKSFKKVCFWRLETFKSFKKVHFWRLETFKSFKNNLAEGLNYLSWRFLKVCKIFFKNSKNMKIVIPALLKMVILKLYVLECTFHPNILSL